MPRIEANGKEVSKGHPNLDQVSPDNYDGNRVIKLKVAPEKEDEIDTILPKFFDFPVAAIRSPPIPVQANNLIRISVLVKRPYLSPGGLGGVIVRDSIGGEQFQFRTNAPLSSFSRVVLFRKAPADCTFTVTLGLAGYAEAYFDDFRVEVIERDDGSARPNMVRGRRARPIERLAGASRPTRTGRRRAAHQHAAAVVDAVAGQAKQKRPTSPPPPRPFGPPSCRVDTSDDGRPSSAKDQ